MPSQKQYLERKDNIASILQHLRRNGPQSRRQIADALHLSWGCVSELVMLLLSQTLLLEEAVAEPKVRGRIPTVLRPNPEVYFLGVDINMVGLKACVCNLLGEPVAELCGELLYACKRDFLTSVTDFVCSVLQEYPQIRGIGFAMQGILHRETNAWEFPAPNGFSVAFETDFANLSNLPFLVAHDPNCILYGCFEACEKSAMVVRLDRGIGAAVYRENVFFNNDLLELGYLVMSPDGKRLHDIVSISAIEQNLGCPIEKITDVPFAKECFSTVGKYLGTALGNICNLIRLDEIYLCGDLIAYYDWFSQDMLRSYQKTVVAEQAATLQAVEVTNAAYGAAKMAMDQYGGL